MSPVANGRPAEIQPLQILYAPIADEMAQVEAILRRELRNDFPFVDELLRYGCLLGGKRLRPALLLLTAKAVGPVTRDHLVLAAVVEMIHTATLIHDDVLDEADCRRHLATVNARWDNEASVLLGDYLFTHAFYLASTLESTMGCRLIGRATNTVCEGELRQVGSRGNFALDESEYLEIIAAKTGALCACCCRLGAYFAEGAADLIDGMDRFGRNLGIAFQIADDLLDVLGDERSTGKSLGTDLEKQKATLPLIRTMQLADEEQRGQLLSVLQEQPAPGREELAPWFERFDAIDYARQKALWYAERARDELELLEPGPACDVLQLITEFVVMRSQ